MKDLTPAACTFHAIVHFNPTGDCPLCNITTRIVKTEGELERVSRGLAKRVHELEAARMPIPTEVAPMYNWACDTCRSHGSHSTQTERSAATDEHQARCPNNKLVYPGHAAYAFCSPTRGR